MFVPLLLCIQFLSKALPVLSEAPPASPQYVHVEKSMLVWSPAPEQQNVTFTVQYSSADNGKWTDVPSCIQTSANECQISLPKSEDNLGCVMLRVHAERRGLKSVPVEACSRNGDSCVPAGSLTVRPGHMTVHLSRNDSLHWSHGDHITHRVYFGKEGALLEDNFKDGVSSVSIGGLQEAQRYCWKVQFLYFGIPYGPPSCPRCKLIPESSAAGQSGKILAVVLVLVLLVLIPVIAYVLIFHTRRLKHWLQGTRYHIPQDYFLERLPVSLSPSSPSEHFDVITSITSE